MQEEWRPSTHVGYEVSSIGRVRKIATGHILKSGSNGYGYLRVCLRGKTVMIATEVAAAFIGPRLGVMQINHKNGVKLDNRVENLEYVTPRENLMHAKRTGLFPTLYGENTSQARLNHLQVRVIRRLKGLLPNRAIGRVFGITQNHVWHIHAGRRWPMEASLAAYAAAKEGI